MDRFSGGISNNLGSIWEASGRHLGCIWLRVGASGAPSGRHLGSILGTLEGICHFDQIIHLGIHVVCILQPF